MVSSLIPLCPPQWEIRATATAQNQFGSAAITTQCSVMGEINGIFWLLPASILKGFPLYMVHQIGRAPTGKSTLLE